MAADSTRRKWGILTATIVGALGVLLVELFWVGAPRLGLLYLGPVVAAGLWVGGWPAVGLAAGIGLARGVFGELPAGDWIDEAVFLAVAGKVVGRWQADRRRIDDFRQFTHGLLERQAEAARTDPLTGIANRRGFYEQIDVELARWERGGPAFGVIYIDLDNFKQVNDRFGHQEGDQLLCRVAETIRGRVKETDVPARIGGDEFVILCWNAGAEALEEIADRLYGALAGLGEGYAEIGFDVSVGVASYERPPAESGEAVESADQAMYEAKRSGREVVIRRISPRSVSPEHRAPTIQSEVVRGAS
jgi:diguanylate cyclase (GGDEF)-like protein